MALSGKSTFSISADTSGLNSLIDELGDAAEKAIRPAAQAAAQVLYERVKANVAGLNRYTGNLDRSIYQAFSPEVSTDGLFAQYNVSWNHKKAPHGHLVEYGYLQRYRYYHDNQGRFRPMVRPGMEGQKPPSRRASAAAKAAYYVTLDTPRQIPGKAFVRNAASAMPEALKAAEAELMRRLLQKKGSSNGT